MVQRVAAGEQEPECRAVRPWELDHLLCQDGGNKADRNVVCNQPVAQHLRIRATNVVDEMKACPGSKIRPDFPPGGVEANTGDLTRAVRSLHSERGLMPVDEIPETGVRDLNAFR